MNTVIILTQAKLFYCTQETLSKSLLWTHPINAGNDGIKIPDTIGVKLINDKSKHCESFVWKVCNSVFGMFCTPHHKPANCATWNGWYTITCN
jgi:hypothetical protein